MNQKNARVLFAVFLLVCMPSLLAEGLSVRVDHGVRAKMRDGVELVADIYRPEAEGSYPVLLERTPYDRKGGESLARELASAGYIVVTQDVRGRYDSQGEFYPFLHESEDGYDTVEWAAQLAGSNGKVGMYGGSYVGATQMLAAISKPPHLASMVPYVTASEYYDGWTYQSGAFMEWFASSWTTGLAQDTLRRKAAARTRPLDWVWELPAASYRILDLPPAEDLAPYYQDWARHETDDAYWRRWTISEHYPEMAVKILHSGGWHDIFLKGTLKNYQGMRSQGPTQEIRDGQRLWVGPWAHASTSVEGKVGDVTFGKQAVLDYAAMIRSFADWALKGVENDFANGDPVRLFVMGENQWRGEKEFPLRRQVPTRYYLHSGRGANGVGGDGSLSVAPPQAEKPDAFVYDPANPVRTIGGRLCCANDVLPPGPFDQSPNESRADVLVFSTPPLAADLEVTGWIRLELYASTSAPDTDFTAMLVDVGPDGYSRFLTDGIVRARFRESLADPDPITPGQVYKYEIDLWATSNLFKAGHRIRLDVSSSNFPRFNRNLNTGEDPNFGTGMSKAVQTIFHDSERPSALVLPVIPR